jgi:hypothetical protein
VLLFHYAHNYTALANAHVGNTLHTAASVFEHALNGYALAHDDVDVEIADGY